MNRLRLNAHRFRVVDCQIGRKREKGNWAGDEWLRYFSPSDVTWPQPAAEFRPLTIIPNISLHNSLTHGWCGGKGKRMLSWLWSQTTPGHSCTWQCLFQPTRVFLFDVQRCFEKNRRKKKARGCMFCSVSVSWLPWLNSPSRFGICDCRDALTIFPINDRFYVRVSVRNHR